MSSQTASMPSEEAIRNSALDSTYASFVDNNEGGQFQDLLNGSTSSWNSDHHPYSFSSSVNSNGKLPTTYSSTPLSERVNSDTGTPIRQEDLFFQQPNSAMDASTDFSFLRKRSGSICTQGMKQYTQPSTPTTARVMSDFTVMTPQSTPRRSNRSNTATPTSGPAPRPTLSQQQRKQRKLSSSIQSGNKPQSIPTSKSTSASKMTSLLASTRRLPLHLPRPNLCIISNPYADLCVHLRRHGMHVEAEEFAAAGGITTDFALRTWIQTSAGGAEGLLNQTNTFLSQHAVTVQAQMSLTKESFEQILPSHFDIPLANLDRNADEQCLTPTHILALQGTASGKGSKGLLLPCHALMYALQCVSLPAFPTSHGNKEGDTMRSLPVSALKVPRPSEFPTLHRFIYTHDASALLMELLPMKHIARHMDHTNSKLPQTSTAYNPFLSDSPSAGSSLPSSAVNALAHLPAQSLLAYAYKVHSAYSNGVFIGLLDGKFWSTLNQAWSLLMAALAIKVGRKVNAERKDPQKDGTSPSS